jgi:hypothetical protein
MATEQITAVWQENGQTCVNIRIPAFEPVVDDFGMPVHDAKNAPILADVETIFRMDTGAFQALTEGQQVDHIRAFITAYKTRQAPEPSGPDAGAGLVGLRL